MYPYSYKVRDVLESEEEKAFTVISTFAGGGGSSIGYKLAGGHVLAVNEIDPLAQKVYHENFPNTRIIPTDIREINCEEVLKDLNRKKGELDILDGSPPCSSFSMAGARERDWGKKKVFSEGQAEQVLDDLFFEYSRLVKEIQPKIFVAENVKGLVSGVAKGYFKLIIEELKKCGYVVKVSVINSAYLSVPQARERVVIIGIRQDLYKPEFKDKFFPKPVSKPITISQALKDIDTTQVKELNPRGRQFILWQMTKPGESFENANKMIFRSKSGYTSIKVNPNKPCPTITASPNLFHWSEPRYLSITEINRLMSFPDDYKNSGSFGKQWARIGYAVPPFMIMHIAANIYQNILTKL